MLNDVLDNLLIWFRQEKRNLPWRNNPSPYEIHVSEIMLQQTRIETVIPYYLNFIKLFPNYDALANAQDEVLMKAWEGLGYYSRVMNLKKAAIIIHNEYHDEFPKDYQKALLLPGIGVYTAGAILSRSYHLPYAAVDGNVLRVLSRFFLDEEDISLEKVKLKYKYELEKYMNNENASDFIESFMELGQTLCLPSKNIQCEKCPLKTKCKANLFSLQNEYPKKISKTEKKIENKTCVFLYDGVQYYLLKKEDGLLKNMFGPLIFDGHLLQKDVETILIQDGYKIKEIKELKDQKHIFTHRIWFMKGYLVYIKTPKNKKDSFTKDEINHQVAIPTCFQKFLKDLLNEF